MATATDGSTVSITVADFAFDPEVVSAPSGSVVVDISNEDQAAHTFTLDDGSIDQDLAGGAAVSVPLELTETVSYHCEIHPSMTGTIEVT